MTMVSVETRRKAAQLLLDFYDGRLTNHQLEDSWPSAETDPALLAIYKGAWFLYSDLHPHYLSAEERRSYRIAKYVHRMLTFLRSQLEYQWKGFPLWRHERLLELFDSQRRKANRSGDTSVWPFYSKTDYIATRAEIGKLRA